MPNELYFIAIIPPAPLKDKIQELKLEVKEKFNSSHSLNAPPHITLISPFRLDKANEESVHSLLEVFTQAFDFLEVQLNNFSTFPPRVIFIDVMKTPGLINIQQRLENMARSNSDIFNYNYDKRPYHPHVTLAFKDLTKSNFHKAWKEFEHQTFNASFKSKKLSLLKHDGERWKEVKTFALGR
jgi:2'-5' RNA ligase